MAETIFSGPYDFIGPGKATKGKNIVVRPFLAMNQKEENSVGLIDYIIDCKGISSEAMINAFLAMLQLKIKEGDIINNYTQITTEQEIDNVGQLFKKSNQFLNFEVACIMVENTTEEPLSFTNKSIESGYTNEFAICKDNSHQSTIQYDETNKQIRLKIYIDLPSFYNYSSGGPLELGDLVSIDSFKIILSIRNYDDWKDLCEWKVDEWSPDESQTN